MRVAFMGTPAIAVPTLEKLYQQHDVVVVITKPDKPTGRNLKITQSEIKEFALLKKTPVIQPTSLKDNQQHKNELEALSLDVVVVVAYGLIIPRWLIDIPPFGCINLHGSLLPEYRGAAPIQRAIMEGKSTTGLTTMLIDEGMDTGDMLLEVEVRIEDDDNNGSLSKKMGQAGADLVIETLEALKKGSILAVPQDDKKATHAEMIDKAEMKIDWNKKAIEIGRQVRALAPKPGAYTYMDGRRVKIFEVEAIDGDNAGPGEVVEIDGELIIATGSGRLIILTLQPEGKKLMRGDEFIRGYQVKVGTAFQ